MKLNVPILKRPRIEMMPLIDAFFLILVYFIYSFLSMSVHRGMPLSLPEARSAIKQPEESLGISVTREGSLFLNKKPITSEALEHQLHQMVLNNKNPKPVTLYGDKEAAHGKVVAVFDLIRRAGITNVLIETDAVDNE